MLISVIVPVYNVEAYLKRCIDSILNQSYKKIEIILVDDGSTDNSGIICDKYKKEYNNIKVVHKKNAGLGMARNSGLSIAKGKFVVFVDSDDYIDDDLIENLYNCAINNKVNYCKFGFKYISLDERLISVTKYDNEIFYGDEVLKKFLPRMLGSLPNIKDVIEMSVTSSIYNISPIKKYKLQFPSERELISEDLVFNIEYMKYSKGAMLANYNGYNYRYNPQSLSKKYRKDRFESSTYFYKTIKKELLNLGYDNETLIRLSKMYFVYIKMSIMQESYRISHKSIKNSVNKIKEICNNETVQKVIDDYPVYKLGFKQRIFLNLVKNKSAILLYFLFSSNLIK